MLRTRRAAGRQHIRSLDEWAVTDRYRSPRRWRAVNFRITREGSIGGRKPRHRAGTRPAMCHSRCDTESVLILRSLPTPTQAVTHVELANRWSFVGSRLRAHTLEKMTHSRSYLRLLV